MPATRATCVFREQDLKKLHPETDSVVPTPSGPSIKTKPSDTGMKRMMKLSKHEIVHVSLDTSM